MAGTRRLTIEILGDTKNVAKAFNDANDDASRFGSHMAKVGKGVALGFAAIGAAAVAAGVVVGKWAKDAIEDNAEQELFERQLQLAGGSNQLVEAFNKQIDAGMRLKGFTDTDLRKAYAQAFQQSKDYATANEDVALAMDIARAAGVPLEQALDAVTKAHNGNERALKTLLPQFGGLIDAAGTSAEALDVVRLNTRGMSDEFANTTAGKIERLKIQFDEIKESIGAAVLPIFEKVVNWLADFLPKAIDAASQAWTFFVGGLTGEFTNEGSGVLLFLNQLGMKIGTVVDWFKKNWPQIRATSIEVLEAVRQGIAGFVQFVSDTWEKWGDEIIAVVEWVWPFVQEHVRSALETVRGIIKLVTSLIKGDWGAAWDGLKQLVVGVFDQIKNQVTAGMSLLKNAIGVAWDGIKAGVESAVDATIDFIAGMPGRILGLLASFASAGKSLAGAIVDGIANGVVSLVSRATDAAKSFANAVIGFINRNVIDKINAMLQFKIAIPGAPDININAPDLPRIPTFHGGGRASGVSFSGMSNDEVVALLRRDETILTPPQLGAVLGAGGGGTVINLVVQVAPTADLASVGGEVVRALEAYEQVNGSNWRRDVGVIV
jgi:F0F1-type ATP synthase membrane subunit c/vacuolar-type H+-ATPase subunit K